VPPCRYSDACGAAQISRGAVVEIAAIADPSTLRNRRTPVSEGARVGQVRLYRRYDYARLNRQKVDAGERHTHPGIDHDSFVQHAVEHVDHASGGGTPLYCHETALSADPTRLSLATIAQVSADAEVSIPQAKGRQRIGSAALKLMSSDPSSTPVEHDYASLRRVSSASAAPRHAGHRQSS